MDQNDRLEEAKIFNEENRTTVTMVLREILPPPIKFSVRDKASKMVTVIRTMEDHIVNAQISHSMEATEIDLKTNLTTIRLETGETREDFLVPHRSKERLLTKYFISPTKKWSA